jgi:hypothetical protein
MELLSRVGFLIMKVYMHMPSVIFNTETQEVYEAEISVKEDAWDEEDIELYRWLNPITKKYILMKQKCEV